MSPVIKKKKKNIQISPKTLLIILSLVCALMMGFTFQTSWFDGPLKQIVGAVVVPFQNGLSSVGIWMNEKAQELSDLREVLDENQQLKEQIDNLTIENSNLQQERYELNALRELYQLDETYKDYDKIGARVISSDSNNWFYTFVIDKGSKDGILVDANVMAGSGLVGRVIETGPDYAVVQSIISDNFNTSCTVLSTGDNLIVNGDLEMVMQNGSIRFEQLADDAEVAPGDKVVTSNISDKYLPGILVGYIGSIDASSNNLTKTGTIVPAVDFEHLSEVLVITELKQQIPETVQESEEE